MGSVRDVELHVTVNYLKKNRVFHNNAFMAKFVTKINKKYLDLHVKCPIVH